MTLEEINVSLFDEVKRLQGLTADLTAKLEAADARAANAERIVREIWDTLYGQGMEVVGWHLNDAPEPIENFFERNDWLIGEQGNSKPEPDDYDRLCDRVEKLDPDAAKWMREVAPGLQAADFQRTGILFSAFIWGYADFPTSEDLANYRYWEDLNDRLEAGNDDHPQSHSPEAAENVARVQLAVVARNRK